jgi:hypothetical protein
MSDLQAMLEQANSIVQQQRSKVQDALTRWRRSSSGGGSSGSQRPSSPGAPSATDAGSVGDAAVAAAMSADSRMQLAQLQHEQQQLMKELRQSLSPRSPGDLSPNLRFSIASSAGNGDTSSAAGAACADAADAGAIVLASPQFEGVALPKEVYAYVESLAERLASLQGMTHSITAEVLAKHHEVSALQDSFTKVRITF